MAEEKKYPTPRGAAATAAKNKYKAKNYDRMELAVPKGMKQALRAAAAQAGYSSFNSYIVDAVKEKFLRDTGKEMTWEKETEE